VIRALNNQFAEKTAPAIGVGKNMASKTIRERTDRILMTKALEAIRILSGKVSQDSAKILEPLIYDLEDRISDMKEEEAYYTMTKEQRDRMKLAAMGNRNLWKPELDPKYQKCKELRASGMTVRDSCRAAGLTTDQWYRRQRIEMYGMDRR
jgi:hypothetical protein